MAVYTALAEAEVRVALAPFDLGEPVAIEAVAAGIENTTYFVTCDAKDGRHEYVLTIGESIAHEDMTFVAELTTALCADGLPVPAPMQASDTSRIISIAGKPALVIPKIDGRSPLHPTSAQCRAAGSALGALHRSTLNRPLAHVSHRDLTWVHATGTILLPHLSATSCDLLKTSLAALDEFVNTHQTLPRAVIHGDLFRDNTLFRGDRLVAMIDFFSAGTGYLLFDLAVAANDWCLSGDRQACEERLQALLSGYAAARAPTGEEKESWGTMLAIAALRFWVSRIADQVFPSPLRPDVPLKDPVLYEKLLLEHHNNPLAWR